MLPPITSGRRRALAASKLRRDTTNVLGAATPSFLCLIFPLHGKNMVLFFLFGRYYRPCGCDDRRSRVALPRYAGSWDC